MTLIREVDAVRALHEVPPPDAEGRAAGRVDSSVSALLMLAEYLAFAAVGLQTEDRGRSG